jgi:hypothetical protein
MAFGAEVTSTGVVRALAQIPRQDGGSALGLVKNAIGDTLVEPCRRPAGWCR